MPPYRERPRTHQAGPPRGDGMVDEIVGQFADRYAFLRELVQNAIDADTESIDVKLTFSPEESLLRAAVSDRGTGMTRNILEEDLVVLFRSSKEDQSGKIGKFGIGFASVLAVEPRLVRVSSSCNGQRHVLHLYPDLTYELFLSGRSNSTGTTVELEIPMQAADVDGFVLDAWQALSRWCQHAKTPIHWSACDQFGQEVIHERIDRPLGFDDALVTLREESEDGSAFLLAVRQNNTPFIAFYNSGLLLHESAASPLGSVSCKIQDPHLGHTLSRDTVLKDKRYEEVLSRAAHLVNHRLPDVIRAALEGNIEAGSLDAYDALSGRVLGADNLREMRTAGWPIPLLHPIEGKPHMDSERFASASGYFARYRSPLTAAMADAAIAVADLETSAVAQSAEPVVSRREVIERLCRRGMVDVHRRFALIRPASDLQHIADRINFLLDRSYRKARAIQFAEVWGRRGRASFLTGSPDKAWLAGQSPTDSWIADDVDRPALARFRRRGIIFNTRNQLVKDAIALAGTHPEIVAAWLARLLLLDHYALTPKRSETLMGGGP